MPTKGKVENLSFTLCPIVWGESTVTISLVNAEKLTQVLSSCQLKVHAPQLVTELPTGSRRPEEAMRCADGGISKEEGLKVLQMELGSGVVQCVQHLAPPKGSGSLAAQRSRVAPSGSGYATLSSATECALRSEDGLSSHSLHTSLRPAGQGRSVFSTASTFSCVVASPRIKS